MRKSLWLILAVLVVAFSAPNAHADSYNATFTVTSSTRVLAFFGDIPSATGPVAFPSPTPISILLSVAANGTPIAPPVIGTLPAFSLPSTIYGWTFTASTTAATFIITTMPGSGVPLITIDYSGLSLSPVAGGDVSETGTLTFAPVNAPEPGSVALMLLGVGLVFVLRKRISRGQQLAV